MINCCIFEDDVVTELFPITETKPIYNCLIGMSSLFDKFYQAFNQSNITLHVRDYLKPTLKEATSNQFPINNINSGSPCLFFNGRVIPTSELVNKIKKIDPLFYFYLLLITNTHLNHLYFDTIKNNHQ